MSLTANEVLEKLLEEGGFVRQGRSTPGLISAQDAKEAPDTDLRYSSLFRKIGGASSTYDRVYEIRRHNVDLPGTPCIYFKTLEDPSAPTIFNLRKQVWNHGRIPTLWIISPDSIRIYDSFARPQEEEGSNQDINLLGELRHIRGQLQNIEQFHKSLFDTGRFWEVGIGRKSKPHERVDSALLRDLSETERLLVDRNLNSSVAHALLGRAIFVKYLEDRKILQPTHFRAYANVNRFEDLLHDKTRTYSFFEWLHSTFNGDLFPLDSAEEKSVQQSHLDILQCLLSGHDMRGYPTTQKRLWPYLFDIIPIELISSIYEMFAHYRDPASAKATSVHYTRYNLVELVLSLGMQGLNESARILDPACGSGVFLVEAFRRLAWLKEKKLGRRLTREELQELLRAQIFGIDIDRDAVYVAAFSLYLAFLELNTGSQTPEALRLPQLLASDEFDNHPFNLYIQDFLNTEHSFNRRPPFSTGEFDLIVSNPPWTALKEKTAPRDPDNPKSGRQWGMEYVRQHKVPDGKPDQAFMWRVRDFSNTTTRIALVIGSRFFYQSSRTGNLWRRKILDNNVIHQVINLSDLAGENLLFGKISSAHLPASVITFSPRQPDDRALILYINPKWYPGIRKQDEIVITGADIQMLPQNLLREKTFLWKSAFRGSPRDFRLLSRLQEFPSLNKVLSDTNIVRRFDYGYGITFGKNPTKNASELAELPFLESGAIKRYRIGIDDCIEFNRPFIAKKSNNRAFRLPVLILNRALRRNKPCVALVEPSEKRTQILFDHMYFGISFASNQESLAHRLNAILNSKLALYMIFMSNSSLGWDWKTIEPKDWMEVRLPPSITDKANGTWRTALYHERWLWEHWRPRPTNDLAEDIAGAEEVLDKEIFSLYGLSDPEIILVEDTIKYTIEPFFQRKIRNIPQGLDKLSSEHLIAYAQTLCSQVNSILRHGNRELSATVITLRRSPLIACRFKLEKKDTGTVVTQSGLEDIEEVLRQISQHLQAEVADRLYVQQDLRVYDNDIFWIIKPAETRLWTRAVALNDADAVVREHLEAGLSSDSNL